MNVTLFSVPSLLSAVQHMGALLLARRLWKSLDILVISNSDQAQTLT